MPPCQDYSTLCQGILTLYQEGLTFGSPKTTPCAMQTILANSRQDISTANSDMELLQLRGDNTNIRTILAPSLTKLYKDFSNILI